MKKESTLKIIGLSALGLIVLWLVKTVLFPTGYGVSARYSMPVYYNNGYGQGFYSNTGFSSFTSLIIQVLLGLFIIGLIIGVVMIVKNYLFTLEEVNHIKEAFTKASNSNEVINENSTCVECGNDLNPDWKVCPHCGNEVKKSKKKKTTKKIEG